MTYIEARTANEVFKAHERRLKLNKLRSAPIDRSKAMAMIYSLGRQAGDAWMNWPARVAPLVASDLSVDVHVMLKCLDKYVILHLIEMPDIEINL